MFDFKILFAIIFIIISDENVNQVFSQIHVRVAYLFLSLFVNDGTESENRCWKICYKICWTLNAQGEFVWYCLLLRLLWHVSPWKYSKKFYNAIVALTTFFTVSTLAIVGLRYTLDMVAIIPNMFSITLHALHTL